MAIVAATYFSEPQHALPLFLISNFCWCNVCYAIPMTVVTKARPVLPSTTLECRALWHSSLDCSWCGRFKWWKILPLSRSNSLSGWTLKSTYVFNWGESMKKKKKKEPWWFKIFWRKKKQPALTAEHQLARGTPSLFYSRQPAAFYPCWRALNYADVVFLIYFSGSGTWIWWQDWVCVRHVRCASLMNPLLHTKWERMPPTFCSLGSSSSFFSFFLCLFNLCTLFFSVTSYIKDHYHIPQTLMLTFALPTYDVIYQRPPPIREYLKQYGITIEVQVCLSSFIYESLVTPSGQGVC